MTKAKTNALEALRALIAERQQYEQWIATLESKRENTPAHVFERVQSDYNTRLNRVLTDIKGHAEELQLSISALSSRLVEVARDEDIRRDALQEAELRAMVGEYEPQQWEQLRSEAERGLEAVGADRASLDGQLTELRSIQKLSEVGSTGNVSDVAVAPIVEQVEAPASGTEKPADAAVPVSQVADTVPAAEPAAPRDQGHLPLDPVAAQHQSAPPAAPPSPPVTTAAPAEQATPSTSPAASGNSTASAAPASASAPAASPPQRARTGKTPPFGSQPAKPKPPESRVDQSKTLKCPECGTANYPTEWYCERCGGELATM